MRWKSPWTIIAVAAGLLLSAAFCAAFYTYGVDELSVAARGGVQPDRTFYVATDDGGLKSLDPLLDSFAKANGLSVSRANFQGNEFPQPRELWKPGISVFVTNEFACRPTDSPNIDFRRTEFIITVTRMSFITSENDTRKLERQLQDEIGRSSSMRLRPRRLSCPT